MAPLLDFSIAGIQASLHGRLEALSATVNCSLTATTYNSKFDVWEPLVEPCTAFIRLELLNIKLKDLFKNYRLHCQCIYIAQTKYLGEGEWKHPMQGLIMHTFRRDAIETPV